MKTYKTQAEVDADTIDGTLRVKDNVLFTCDTVLQKHLIVSGSIEAGGSIKAGWSIVAGGSIKAGGSIEAGNDYGIYCGLSVVISLKESFAFVTATEKPKNLLLGKFKQKEKLTHQ